MSDSPEPKRKVGLRQNSLPASSLSVDRTARERSERFENMADEQYSKILEYKNEMVKLATEFKRLINDTVLPDNKGPVALSVEKEVLDKLIKLSSSMNEDETQEECAGSNALCTIIMKCMFYQRDTINKLSYKVAQLEANARKQESKSE